MECTRSYQDVELISLTCNTQVTSKCLEILLPAAVATIPQHAIHKVCAMHQR